MRTKIAFLAALLTVSCALTAFGAADPSRITVTDPGAGQDATDPAVVYDSAANRYLAVYASQNQVRGRFVSAAGAPDAADFKIAGTAGTDVDPDVAFDPDDGGFTVVWRSTLALGGSEIYAVRLDRAGQRKSPADTQVSTMGPNDTALYNAATPDVAYSSTSGQFLVTWSGNDDVQGLGDPVNHVFTQVLDATGAKPGDVVDINSTLDDNYRPQLAWDADRDRFLLVYSRVNASAASSVIVQTLGPDGKEQFGEVALQDDNAADPAIVYNPAAKQFLVAWDGANLIRVRRVVDGAGPEPVGTESTPVASAGPPLEPALATAGGEYLVTYRAAAVSAMVGEFEIYGQRLTAGGSETGADDFRISTIGADRDADRDAYDGSTSNAPGVAYGATPNEYFVAYNGDESADDDFAVFAQRLPGPVPGVAPAATPAISAVPTVAATATPAPTAAPDLRSPRLTISVDRRVARGKVTLIVSCDEACTATVKVGKRRRTVVLAGGAFKRTVKVKLPGKVRKAVGRGRHPRLRVSGTATDTAGNRSTPAKGTVRIKRRG